MGKGTVLVTGGSGYIAGFCIRQLIAEGWDVRATVRSLKRESEVRGWLEVPAERLRFIEADLVSDAGWADAVQGADYVLHVASPIPTTTPKNDDELVIPARDGALRVLRAAKAANVKRVVMTSSTAAVTYGVSGERYAPFTEADWTDPTHKDTSPYVRSKTIAERAAWDWVSGEGRGLELATINPGAVLGPVLGNDFSASIEIVKKILEGSLPMLPNLGFPLIDVRDVADAHVKAMTAPGAPGQRFLVAGDFWWFKDIAAHLVKTMPAQTAKAPTAVAPDWLMRLLALFDPVTKSVTFELGRERPVSSAKAKQTLGLTFHKLEDTIVETAQSLLAKGVVKRVG
jgi:dihydroflavonol-4-reductase